jgi:acyl-coenzyme A thioesterase PaaI-like protein
VSGIELPWSVLSDYQCFGCSPHNTNGLRLVLEPHPEGACSRFSLDRAFESYPGVVHGGLIGVICDEIMGNLIVLRHGTSAFTVSMRQRFISPLAVGEPYVCVARVDRDTDGHRLYHASADILDGDGTVCAMATATYQPFALADQRGRVAVSEQEVAALSAALAGAATLHSDRQTLHSDRQQPTRAPNGADHDHATER